MGAGDELGGTEGGGDSVEGDEDIQGIRREGVQGARGGGGGEEREAILMPGLGCGGWERVYQACIG